MPCIFLIASTIAIILSSLPATIIICMPIAHAIAQSLHINSALMAATIIGGALYGNHLSLYFNSIKTHIKSTPTDSINIYKKTIWFILLAALSTLIILSQYQCQIIHPAVYDYLKASLEIQDSITVLPYVFLLIAAYFKINLLANLTLACCITLITEIIYHKILFLDAITTMFHGFYEESIACNLLLLHIITAGLIEIIKYNGGFIYIIEKLNLKGDQNSSIVEGSIICMTIIVNMLVIIDKLAFNLLANYIKKLCDTYNISQSKAIILSQIIATTMQTILPYSSIMFLAIYIHKSSFIEIMSYMIYPILVIIMTILSVLFSNSNIENKNESYNIHKNS